MTDTDRLTEIARSTRFKGPDGPVMVWVVDAHFDWLLARIAQLEAENAELEKHSASNPYRFDG